MILPKQFRQFILIQSRSLLAVRIAVIFNVLSISMLERASNPLSECARPLGSARLQGLFKSTATTAFVATGDLLTPSRWCSLVLKEKRRSRDGQQASQTTTTHAAEMLVLVPAAVRPFTKFVDF